MPLPKLRASTAFIAGLLLLVAALALIAAVRRWQSRGAPPAQPPADLRAPLLGPRAADEPTPSASFEPQGRRSGSEGAFYVLGMVKNTSPFAVDKPRVVVTLLGAGATALATREGYAERDLLAPGESSPAKVLIGDPPAHERLTYAVSARRALYDPGAVSGLKVLLEGEPKQNFATWEIAGTVIHEGKVPARSIKIELVIRNAAGAMIGVDSAVVDSDKLEPGQSARFSANVLLDEKPIKIEPGVSARPAL